MDGRAGTELVTAVVVPPTTTATASAIAPAADAIATRPRR
jgi:hypothetical protein